MKKFIAIALLAGCTLDPEAPLEATELQVTVVGLGPQVARVDVTIARAGTPIAAFEPPVVDGLVDVWFRDLPVGQLDLVVRTDRGERCERAIVNASGPQQEVVDLSVPCEAVDGVGGEGGGGDEHEDDEPEGEGDR